MHKVLRNLVISDLFILSSYALISPIFAVFVLKSIPGSTISSIGIAVTIDLFTRSVFQIMFAKWADEERGNKREMCGLLVGSILISLVPLGWLFSTSIAHIYIVQFFSGLSKALSFPSWRVLFSRYVRDRSAGYEWGLYDTVTSLGMAAAAAIGAYFAEEYSFTALLIIVTVFSFVGTGFIFHIFKLEFSKPKSPTRQVHHHIKRKV